MHNNNLLLILGNQLFPIEYIKKTNVNKIFMAEDYGLCINYKHHKLKILMFFQAMRQYKEELIQNGYQVIYHSIEDNDFKDTFEKKIHKTIDHHKIENIKYFEIEDHFFEKKIVKFIKNTKINFEIFKSPMFLCSRSEFKEFALSQKKKNKNGKFLSTNEKKIIYSFR